MIDLPDVDPKKTICPDCGAPRNSRCMNKAGVFYGTHRSRIQKAFTSAHLRIISENRHLPGTTTTEDSEDQEDQEDEESMIIDPVSGLWYPADDYELLVASRRRERRRILGGHDEASSMNQLGI
jgi:hypothetical protein